MMDRRSGAVVVLGISPGELLAVPVVVTTLLWVSSPNPVEPFAAVCAFVVLLMSWGSYLCWRAGDRSELPLFSMVSAAYWVYFALALFWGRRSFSTALASAAIVPSEETITATVFMALIGVMCLWIGMRTPISFVRPGMLPDIEDRRFNWTYVRLVLLGGVALALRSNYQLLLGSEGRQLMATLTSVVPNAAFVLLLNRYLTGESTRADQITLAVGGIAVLASSLASGWLGPAVSFGIICGSLILLKRRRLPMLPIIATALLLVFLQVGKNDFRNTYWTGGETGDLVDRVEFWVSRSVSIWSDALSSNEDGKAVELASRSLERASLLTQAAHVLEMTPSQVPFQEGSTYRFLFVTWVPRALWPDKPSVSEANQFYQIAYGLTSERNVGAVSIAVGTLTESYINFGWYGVVGVMLFVGLVLGIFQRTFAVAKSSALFLAVGLALVPQFLSIESQLAVYMGGIVQQATLALLLFLPLAGRQRPASMRVPAAA